MLWKIMPLSWRLCICCCLLTLMPSSVTATHSPEPQEWPVGTPCHPKDHHER